MVAQLRDYIKNHCTTHCQMVTFMGYELYLNFKMYMHVILSCTSPHPHGHYSHPGHCHLSPPTFLRLHKPCDLSSRIHSHLFCTQQPTQSCVSLCTHVGFFKRFYVFIFRERGTEGERKGEKHQCARETWICCPSHTSYRGPDLQPRHVPWLVTFLSTGQPSIHWATPARASCVIFKMYLFIA